MAGTIIATPAIGASSWESWITQQGATDTGFMRVSLTNFSGTAASNVATGSVMECAGSIYSFTDTSIALETGTNSSATAVYYVAIPSTDTTVSIYMEGTAPTWVDAKQGFYQSAASLTRYIGGAYIGTAATYYTKFLYTGENLVYCLQTGKTRPLFKKILEIGEWNMDATESVTPSHGLGRGSSIRGASVTIVSDAGGYINLEYTSPGGVPGGHIGNYEVSTIKVARRATPGEFDDTAYNGTVSTVANRGWITITYEA